MKLEDLYKPFSQMSPLEKLQFITSYREKRLQDFSQGMISNRNTKVKKTSQPRTPKKIAITPEELALLKKLGMI